MSGDTLLRWRLISAAVILAVLLTLVWLDFRQAVFGVPGVWLLPVLLAVSLLAAEEVLSLVGGKDLRPVAWVIYLGTALINLAAALPMFYQFFGWKLARCIVGARPLDGQRLFQAGRGGGVHGRRLVRHRRHRDHRQPRLPAPD